MVGIFLYNAAVHFPVYFRVLGFSLNAHVVMECLAYTISFQLYLLLKRKFKDVVSPPVRWQVIAAAAFGAALGSRILGWLEDPLASWHAGLLGGKTIIGGLIGAWIAVELVKAKLGVATRTGDLFAIPLSVGIAIGRIGCFLSGLPDQTYGTPTTLPWGVDFGDGIRRHPTQLYEIVFLVLLCAILWRALRAVSVDLLHFGDVFRLFMISYTLWRLLIDFLKPEPRLLALSTLQWACVGVLIYCWPDLRRMVRAGFTKIFFRRLVRGTAY